MNITDAAHSNTRYFIQIFIQLIRSALPQNKNLTQRQKTLFIAAIVI